MPPKKSRTERLNISIDQTLKRQFDAVCALKGLSMSDIANNLIKGWVGENAPPGLLEGTTEDNNPPTSSSAKSTSGKGRGKGVKDD